MKSKAGCRSLQYQTFGSSNGAGAVSFARKLFSEQTLASDVWPYTSGFCSCTTPSIVSSLCLDFEVFAIKEARKGF